MHPTQVGDRVVSVRKTLPRAQVMGGRDVAAASCCADWRACRPGDVFVAVTTAGDDGHDHVERAVARGATAVIAERLLPVNVPQFVVRDSRVALARLCQALAGNPSRSLVTVGIAGSAGKTTTVMLVASVLEAAGRSAGVLSSLGHSDSVTQCAATSQTPTAPEFAAWLARMHAAQCDAAVLELSSVALAERRIAGVGLEAAVLTNIQSTSSEAHNSAAAYQKIQRRVLKHLKAGGTAIINADDHRCRGWLAEVDQPCLTYALHAEADITAQVLERLPSEQTFLLSAGSDTAPVRTRMIGDMHVSSCLAAAAAGLALGIDLEAIVRGLEAVERVPGRMERLECGQPFSVFVDAAKTPEALTQAIRTVRQVASGRVLVVFGPDENASPARRALLGRVLERGAHLPIVTSSEPGQSKLQASAHDLLDGFERPHRAQLIPNRAAAIRFALAKAEPGDAVLIAGRDVGPNSLSPAMPSLLEDDREIACQWLYGQGERELSRPRLRVVG